MIPITASNNLHDDLQGRVFYDSHLEAYYMATLTEANARNNYQVRYQLTNIGTGGFHSAAWTAEEAKQQLRNPRFQEVTDDRIHITIQRNGLQIPNPLTSLPIEHHDTASVLVFDDHIEAGCQRFSHNANNRILQAIGNYR